MYLGYLVTCVCDNLLQTTLFYDTSTQTNSVPNIARPVRYNTTNLSYGVVIIDNTKITILNTGRKNWKRTKKCISLFE